jgi:hypothetical protein
MVSATDGWAVGWNRTNAKYIVLHLDGTSWTQVPGPAPGKGALFGVSADSATDAWTAGPLGSSRNLPAQVLHWDGTGWTQVPIAVSGLFADLDAVSAASASDAWIIGLLVTRSQAQKALTLHWDGTGWTRVPSPDLGPQPTLKGVSDASAGNAWAVGWAGGPPKLRTLALHWDGSTWRRVFSPSPGHQLPSGAVIGNELNGVDTVSDTNAWAVGDYTVNGSTRQAALILHWNGTRWTQQPNPGGTSDSFLNGISMVSATDGWAVGSDSTGALILHWNGTTWSRS